MMRENLKTRVKPPRSKRLTTRQNADLSESAKSRFLNLLSNTDNKEIGMRAWIYHEKCYGNIGDRRFQVEWEVLSESAKKKIAKDSEYEVDFHWDFDYEQLHFKTKAEAMAAAEKVVESGAPFFGRAMVEEQVVDWLSEEDRVAEWARVGDFEEVA